MRKLILFVLLLVASPAWATTYYTAKDCTGGSAPPNCSDANDGLTRQTAELTVAAGIAHLAAGDTLIIGNGTYTEQILNTVPAGSMGSPTTVRAENDPTIGSKGQITANVTLQPGSGTDVIRNTHAYVTFRGLNVDATNADGSPFQLYNGGTTFNGMVIQYNRAHGGNNNVSSMSGIMGDAANSTIEYNEVDHNGDSPGGNQDHGIYTPGPSNTIRYNYVHDNEAYCLVIYPGANSNTLYGNRCESNDSRGIILSGDTNLFYNNIQDSDNWGTEVNGSNNKLYNNTLYNNGHGAGGTGQQCIVVESGSGNLATNNICYANEVNSIIEAGGTITSTTTLYTNPNFNNAGGQDFTLTASSTAAIDAGTDLSATFGTDFLGAARPIGLAWDVGAYEFNSGGGGGGACDATDTSGFDGSEDPLSEAGCWTSTNGASGHTKVTGFAQAKVLGEYPNARWTNTSLPSDHYETIVWNFNTSASWTAFMAIRLNASNAGYEFYLRNDGVWALNRRDGGSVTLLQGGTITPLATETIRLAALASTISVTRNGVLLGSAVDATYSGTGRFVEFGIHAVTALTDIKADSFEVGTSGGGTIEVLTPALSSIQQRPANVSTSWTVSSEITSGTVDVRYSFDSFITSYLIATGVAYNASPLIFAPDWPAQASMQIRVCQASTCGTGPVFTTRGQYLK